MSIERVRSACRSLEFLGARLGWALPVLGLLSSVERLIATMRIGDHSANWSDWLGAFLGVIYLLAIYGLAGMGSLVLSRLLAAVVTAHVEHLVRDEQHHRSERMEIAADAIDRLARTLEPRNGTVTAEAVTAPTDDRARSRAEIEAAIRASIWHQADAMLVNFAAEYPDDPSLAALREELASARLRANREQLAQLEVAREVNDPDRVLEIRHALMPSLEFEERNTLDRELAKWFLTLIHRRLRTGTIQADVVELASRFAEAFATTVEGASVRAALPTLRRSVGLCPRCSQPYVGLAEACPKCLNGGPN